MSPRCDERGRPSTTARRIARFRRQTAPADDAPARLPASWGPDGGAGRSTHRPSANGQAPMTAPSVTELNRIGADCLPGHLGVAITHADAAEVRAEMAVSMKLMAPNGYLHAGSVVTLADTSCGHACIVNLPEGATGFTTIELKSNFLGTAREGMLDCVATAQHRGRTTQVWDAVVTHRETGRTIALFRCTQMILWPQSA